MVRRALWLERAVLIAGDPGVGGRGWGGWGAGARRPLHGVHSAYAVERKRERGVSGCEQGGGTDEATVLGQHALRRQSASQYFAMILSTPSLEISYGQHIFWYRLQCKHEQSKTLARSENSDLFIKNREKQSHCASLIWAVMANASGLRVDLFQPLECVIGGNGHGNEIPAGGKPKQ